MSANNVFTKENNVENIYFKNIIEEENAKELLAEFKKEYPNVINKDNINEILENLQNRETKRNN